MPIPLLAAAIPAAASLAGVGAQTIAAGKLNAKNRQFQEDMMWHQHDINVADWQAQNRYNENMWQQQKDYNEGLWNKQNEYNQKLWNMQNQYDSPAAQMDRYRAAGLNPNLVYGNTSGGGGDISSAPLQTADASRSSGIAGTSRPSQYLAVQPPNLGDALSTYMDLRIKSAQVNNLEAQNSGITANSLMRQFLQTHQKDGWDMDQNIKNERFGIMQQIFGRLFDELTIDRYGVSGLNNMNPYNPDGSYNTETGGYATKQLIAQRKYKMMDTEWSSMKEDLKRREHVNYLNDHGVEVTDPGWMRAIVMGLDPQIQDTWLKAFKGALQHFGLSNMFDLK